MLASGCFKNHKIYENFNPLEFCNVVFSYHSIIVQTNISSKLNHILIKKWALKTLYRFLLGHLKLQVF